MRHLDLVAAVDRASYAFFLVDTQNVAEISRTVAENSEIFAHTLLEQAEHERFRQGGFDKLRQSSGQSLVQASGLRDRAGAFAHQPVAVSIAAREHQLVFST